VALLIKKDLHIFGEKKADVNWDNENVRKELYEVLRWWLDRGVDGFRVREHSL
jgi:glycosidase